uniref:Uncharacterized protein n=1 Tax=Anguilla anguilla TaxID=7936 RepID=A0A0E9RS11_ANGAN
MSQTITRLFSEQQRRISGLFILFHAEADHQWGKTNYVTLSVQNCTLK